MRMKRKNAEKEAIAKKERSEDKGKTNGFQVTCSTMPKGSTFTGIGTCREGKETIGGK